MKTNSTPNRALLIASLISSIALTSCATDDPNRRAKTGAGIGAVVGAVIGKQAGGDDKVLIGAAIGALAGAAVGNYQDKQQAALEAALETELAQQQIDVERLDNDVLLVRMSNEASFDFDSAFVKAAFRPTLNKIATQTSTYDKTVLHIVGYTDSIGTDEYNYELSRDRAVSVANYLRRGGVIQDRLRTEGRGESEPRLPNTTEANRAVNRRVEIYIKPVIKGDEQQAFERPLRRR